MGEAAGYVTHIEEALDALALGKTEEAVSLAESVLEKFGPNSAAVHVLGLVAAQLDEPARTLELLKLAHDLDPGVRDYADALAIANARVGRLGDSLFYGKLAAALAPHPEVSGLVPKWLGTFEEAFSSISEPLFGIKGDTLLAYGNVDAAIGMYRRDAEVNFENPDVWRLYAERLMELGRSVDALLAFRKAGEVDNLKPLDEARIAGLLGSLGRFDDMRGLHESIFEDGNLTPAALSQIIVNMSYDPANDRSVLEKAERIFCETFPPEKNLLPESRSVDRGSLKIGLVTSRLNLRGDLDFLWRVLTVLQSQNIATYVYANDHVEDTVARRVQGVVASWVDAREIDDLTLGTIIRNDGIHILLDLDGHRAGGRPNLFLHQPAQCALRLGGLPESAEDQGFSGVIGDDWIYPASEDGAAPGNSVIRTAGGLYRLSILGVQLDFADPEGAPCIALTLTGADIDDRLVSALADACRQHPDLTFLLSADRLGGDGCDVPEALVEAGLKDRVHIVSSSFLRAPEDLAKADAMIYVGPDWARALNASLSRGTPVFAVRGRLPDRRMADSVLGSMGLEDFLLDGAGEAIDRAVAVATDRDGEGNKARAVVREAVERVAGTDFAEEWGKDFQKSLVEAYDRFASGGDS